MIFSNVTKLTPYVLGIVALALWHYVGYLQGAASVRTEWHAERETQLAEISRLSTELANASAQVVTEYVDRVQVVREKGQTIVREVPVYVPSDSCSLPGGFRVLHDSAATGSDLPEPAAAVDARAVTAQDAAATITGNYATCRQTIEQLKALQQWARSITSAQGAVAR